jgi:glycosyltransferase involved in cell wall biosynthesis
MLPKVSAYCPTYGRPFLLEESIQCFLNQDYQGEKELIILNDYSGYTLHFDHPEVKVYNVKEHIRPLGKKFNETIKLCTGDILFAWEDDDIFLPHRLSLTVEKMQKSGKEMFHTQEVLLHRGDGSVISVFELYGAASLFHSSVAIKRSLFEQTGGYQEDKYDSIQFDQVTMDTFFKFAKYKSENHGIHESFYIYRYDTTGSYNSTNFSGWTATKGELSLGAELYLKENKNNLPKGDYFLKPHWKQDYVSLANNYLAKFKK